MQNIDSTYMQSLKHIFKRETFNDFILMDFISSISISCQAAKCRKKKFCCRKKKNFKIGEEAYERDLLSCYGETIEC